jgi:hypothetical protein
MYAAERFLCNRNGIADFEATQKRMRDWIGILKAEANLFRCNIHEGLSIQ